MSPINSVRALLHTSYYVQNFSRSSTFYYGSYPDSNYSLLLLYMIIKEDQK